MMGYRVYILYSMKYNKTYCGYTNHMDRRLEDHNISSGKGYTIRYRPWVIDYQEHYMQQQEAKQKEQYYKTGVGRELIKRLVAKYKEQN